MRKKPKSSSLLSKILIPMMALAVTQVVIFVVILAFQGGFAYTKQYAYSMIAEKTENRRNYVESTLNQNTALAVETAEEVGLVVEEILADEHVTAAAVKTDKELNKRILSECAELLISLVRRGLVNDAFLILDSGSLYDEDGRSLRTGIYLRDTDVQENSISDNQDIFMEMGGSRIAREYGLPLDYGWSLYLDVTDRESGKYDYFYEPIETWDASGKTPLYNLGYWNPDSRVQESQLESVTYSLPLVSADGTVYGVIGVGLLQKTIQASMPANDFERDSACYILGTDLTGSGQYTAALYTGAAYRRLISEETVLDEAREERYGLRNFTVPGGTSCVGSIQKLNLYQSGSPYRDQEWALISVVDRKAALGMYHALTRTVLVSVLLALCIGIFLSALISRRLSRPVDRMVKTLDEAHSGNQLVEFTPSGIREIDVLGTAILDLQEEVAKVKDEEYTEKLLEANTALRDAYAAATRANHAKTDFLSRMSHDIRTPMNAIISMTAIAQSYLNDPLKISDCLEKISVSGRYLLSLINDVLDMSKIEAGKLELAKEEISLPELIDTLVEMVMPSVKERNHELKVQVEPLEHENVLGDSLRIQQVFMNIMSNAVKYTPAGGHIEFRLSEQPAGPGKVGCYEFFFRDDGCGMSPEFLSKIFEPFERADDERVNQQQGTGLGMAITYNIVKMMDGNIRVESEPGKGSAFTVTVFLELQEKESVQHTAAAAGSGESTLETLTEQDFSGRRGLLVDDNELNREIAVEILGMAGFSVETAVNGREAVEKFEAAPVGYYDVIFMDVQMPVMNGYQATKAIRILPREDARKVLIVAMTANAFAEDVRAAKEAGMDEHIAKPLDLDKLFAVLRKRLG